MLPLLSLLCTLMAMSGGLAAQIPGPLQIVPAKIGETPSCAQNGEHYCEHVENYPEELIKKLVKAVPPELRDSLFDEDQYVDEGRGYDVNSESPIAPVNSLLNTTILVNNKKAEQLCPLDKTVAKPRAAFDHKLNQWVYIVNVENGVQIQKGEKCLHENENCSQYLKKYETSKCQTQVDMSKLLALHPSGKKLYIAAPMKFTCCKCVLHNK